MKINFITLTATTLGAYFMLEEFFNLGVKGDDVSVSREYSC